MIRTDLTGNYSDPYYHELGIATIDDRKEKRFHDVYSLTRYYMDKIILLGTTD